MADLRFQGRLGKTIGAHRLAARVAFHSCGGKPRLDNGIVIIAKTVARLVMIHLLPKKAPFAGLAPPRQHLEIHP
jgi:hypothetical protein